MNDVPLRRLLTIFDDSHPNGYRTPDEDGGREYHFIDVRTGAFVPKPLLGDVYVRPYHRWCPWTNCDGVHLIVLIPSDKEGAEDAHEWSPQNRASNCTLKNDTLHRCWVLHGDVDHPETLHVDKDSLTCTAGGGSIQFGDWHGYLSNGFVTTAHERRKWRQGLDGRWWAPNPEPVPHVVAVHRGVVVDPTVQVPLPAHPFIPKDRQRQKRR